MIRLRLLLFLVGMDTHDSVSVSAMVTTTSRKKDNGEGESQNEGDADCNDIRQADSLPSPATQLSDRAHTVSPPLRMADHLAECWQSYSIEEGQEDLTQSDTKDMPNACDKVLVVADDQPSTKNQIRLHEMLIAHANAHHGVQNDFSIGENYSDDPRRPSQSLKDGCGIEVTFHRAPRMPDDNKLHQLPGSLGTFELYNVESYTGHLPMSIREVGGVFLGMWQREAMWINFEVNQISRWAVRVFIGRINAVSGLIMDQDQGASGETAAQDYLVVPGQRWLDGICVARGVVRQFIAMPCMSGRQTYYSSADRNSGLRIHCGRTEDNGREVWRLANRSHS